MTVNEWFENLFATEARYQGVALVIRGERGCGKTRFVEEVAKKLPHTVAFYGRVPTFSGKFAQKRLVIFDDLPIRELTNLKPYIDTPKILVEEMAKDPFVIYNRVSFLLTTSDMKIGEGERRFLPVTLGEARSAFEKVL